MTNSRKYLLARGFALLEALVASGVLGFGLLAVGRLQVALYGNSDLAKQRSEAVQLGEQKVEDLRAYSALGSYQGMATGSDTVTGSSASYTRAWTVVNSAITAVAGTYPVYKDVKMLVSWTGRTGATESVTINSIVAMYDVALGGQVVVPPPASSTRKPRNRDVNIPWPAVRLGGDPGTSGFTPPGAPSGTAIIFNDETGEVSSTCTSATLPTSDNDSEIPTDTTGWNCTGRSGYLLAGFIRVPPYRNDSDLPPTSGGAATAPISNFDITYNPAANTSPESGTASLFQCYDDAGGTLTFAGYISYACVIELSGSPAATAWSGTTSFSATGVTWGTGDGQWFICRYVPGAPEVTYFTTSPAGYRNVKQSLDNENYALVQGSRRRGGAECPPVEIPTVPPTTLVIHQAS